MSSEANEAKNKVVNNNPISIANQNNNQPTDLSSSHLRLVTPPVPRVIPRVVIVGAGFGGLNAAKVLADSEVEVIIIDRNNYHGFWPLLYQVATAGLEPSSIAYPVRAIVRKYRNITFQMGEVKSVDFENKRVITDGEPIDYDYLVLSAGSANNYFGNDTLAHNTFGLKDVDEAERLRNRVLASFEMAAREPDPEKRLALMTFLIVGGGPTGVELAGAFAELIRHVLRKDYPMLNVAEARIVLAEGSGKILGTFKENLQRMGLNQLERLGVEVRLNAIVNSVENGVVTFKDTSRMNAGTVIWAAGVKGADLGTKLGVPLARGQRVPVERTLNLAERPEVFVIGDMSYLEDIQTKQPYPQVAQVAMQMGKIAARNILANIRKRPTKEFHYFDKGSMATIGRRSAVFDAFGVRMVGFLAWVAWLFVHLMYLVGFRNRVLVFLNWAYSYFTYDRAVRLIAGRR